MQGGIFRKAIFTPLISRKLHQETYPESDKIQKLAKSSKKLYIHSIAFTPIQPYNQPTQCSSPNNTLHIQRIHMKKNHNDALINIRLPKALHEQLTALADAKYMPLSVMVRIALSDYLHEEAPSSLSSALTSTRQPKPRKWTRAEIEEAKQLKYEASQIQWGDADIPKPPSKQQEYDEWD